MVTGRFPTVPEYYSEFINKGVDLTLEPKQCCPFHQENTPSFSYNRASGRWSCFGRCHAHGDVIEMHKRWFHYATKEEAEKDLRMRYRLPKESIHEKVLKASEPIYVSDDKIQDEAAYVEACALANTPDRWLELDYVMSKHPFDRTGLFELIYRWKGVKSLLD